MSGASGSSRASTGGVNPAKGGRTMATFFMFGKYTAEALPKISAKRTNEVTKLVEQAGGKVKSIHALLGKVDLVIVIEMPGVEEVMKLSVTLAKKTGIVFTCYPAVPVETFDKLMA
jgi:uncharacterized protein with GYD domain